jgi:glycerophosphoryl diester phosphodiesterase
VDDEEVPDRAGTGVLTLAMLCELVHDAGRPIRLFVETKHPNRYAGLVEKELVELLRYFGWAGQPGPATGLRRRAAPETTPVLVMSFAPIALRRVRLLAPDVSTVLLRNRSHPGWLLPPGVRVAGPSLKGLRADPDFVDRLHRYHRQVYVWTVDEPEDVDFVVGLGVDMIATNRPGDVAKRVHA